MALPSSGPLSFSAIQGETSSATFSLRAMSAIAGFSTPDAVSEFYGYGVVTYTYLTDYAAGDPCNYDYWEIYLGSDGIYYRFDGTYYDPMYNYTTFWYEYLYYEPLFPADIYQEWEINSASTVLTSNGNVVVNCFM
jgi:hypothetical protein